VGLVVGAGDIKCENVCVTSYNWVLLTDFATFKPTFLPAGEQAPDGRGATFFWREW